MRQQSSLAPLVKTSVDLNLVSPNELFKGMQEVFDSIARRAYELFESRGRSHGNDWDDWFRAESELLKPVKFQVVESGDQLIARAEVSGFSAHEIKVSLEPRYLRISGKVETHKDHKAGKAIHSLRRSEQIFHVVELPAEVDPLKARSTFKDAILEVVMPKAALAKSARVQTKVA